MSKLHQRGDAERDRLDVGAAARTSSTASVKMSSVSCRSAPRQVRWTLWWTTIPWSTTPPRSFVPPASIPITRLGGMAGRYTEGGERPDSRPPGIQGLPRAAPAARGRRRPRRAAASGSPGIATTAASRAAPARSSATSPRAASLKWVALAIAGWLLLSLVLFLISAQTRPGVSPATERALSSSGSLFSGSNILVLGSDVRKGDSIDKSQAGPGRSDTIMLVHSAFGSVRKLSIPRDVEVNIPGHGVNKVNAAYAFGGPALTIQTLESFLGNGLQMNHVVEVDFEEFPHFIDALGGVTVNNKTRICSPPFDNFWKGLHFKKGEHPPQRAARARLLARAKEQLRARTRTTATARAGSSRCLRRSARRRSRRARSSGCRWVSWNAPRTLKSDMNGFQLMVLFADMATGNSSDTEVLEATCCNGSNLFVSEGSKRDAVGSC